MAGHVFQNQYRMSYLSPRDTEDVDSQSLQNSQWDFKCLSTRHVQYHVKKTILKRGISDVRIYFAFRSI